MFGDFGLAGVLERLDATDAADDLLECDPWLS